MTISPNSPIYPTFALQALRICVYWGFIGRDPLAMYESLCALTGMRHDPCVADVFLSVTRFIDVQAPKAWLAFAPEHKQLLDVH